ncbi:MAG: hypothetical protein B6I22_05995 [Desulfobacteraceae bacterium 4572_123]|nr:MAG: hypothetical protein B6I22_05995 [Desulfobacteraceae bacterium 4572_123]
MATYRRWLDKSLKKQTIYTQKYLNVQKYNFGALDEGPGVRHAVFLQGCPNFCPGCRNMEAKKLRQNKLLPPQSVSRDITRARSAKFTMTGHRKDTGFQKILYVNALRHILWDILNTHEYVLASGKNDISEYIRLAKVLFTGLSVLLRGHDPSAAPRDWLELPIQGVTISGGEPLLQPVQVKRLIGYVRERRPDWDICLYSGLYSWEEMLNDPLLRSVVEMTDMVKVGAFQWKNENVAHFYFGSTNQILLDSKKSLAHQKPVAYEYSMEIEAGLQMSSWHRHNKRVPVLRDDTLDILRLIRLGTYTFDMYEEFEMLFGKIDKSMFRRIFEFKPRVEHKSVSRNYFKQNTTLNIAHVDCTPLATAEKQCVNVYLQGSEKPPAVDTNPGMCDIGFGKEMTVDSLLDHLRKIPPWYFAADRKEEKLEFCRLNLALQNRLLDVQTDYFMLHSPSADMTLKQYQRIVGFYQKQVQLFFSLKGAGRKVRCKTLFLRGGDALLQANALSRFCRQAHEAGFDIWVEIPYPLQNIRKILASVDFMQYVDCIVCGKPHKKDFPCILPFQSSIDQCIYHADTLSPWRPRHMWSEQIMAYAQAFKNPETIAGYTLPTSIINYFQHHGPKALSVESFEQLAGPVETDWITKKH